MTISFDIFDHEIPYTRLFRQAVNQAIADRLETIGHKIPIKLLREMDGMSPDEAQKQWQENFRALGYIKCAVFRDESRSCWRYVLTPSPHANPTPNA